MSFLLRKTIAALLYPPFFCLLLALLGLLLTLRRGTRPFGLALAGIALFTLVLLSIPALQEGILSRYENRFPVLLDPAGDEPPAWIVVLGGGVRAAPPGAPATARLSPTGLARAVEAVRLARRYPSARLLFTGGTGSERPPSSTAMSAVATSFGIDPDRITIASQPTSTAEEAAWVRDRIGSAPVLLVSSALHLPRAVGLFRSAGLDPTPAPAGFLSDGSPGGDLRFLPSASTWRNWQALFHEWYGILWARLRGTLQPEGGT